MPRVPPVDRPGAAARLRATTAAVVPPTTIPAVLPAMTVVSRRGFLTHTVGGLAGGLLLSACAKDDDKNSHGDSDLEPGDLPSDVEESTGDNSDVLDTSVDLPNGTDTPADLPGDTTDDNLGDEPTESTDTSDASDVTEQPGDEPDMEAATCVVYPLQMEGPFYLDLNQLRRDITEGKPGTPLKLLIEVVAASDCRPLRDVVVDIWQCDAGGIYSGFPGQLGGLDTSGLTFLRGSQISGDDGVVEFHTIYPGWYPGRTTHIHFKVHTSATREATSQFYFPEEINAEAYTVEPYAVRGPKDTTNLRDGVNRGVVPPLLAIQTEGTGYVGRLRVAVAD